MGFPLKGDAGPPTVPPEPDEGQVLSPEEAEARLIQNLSAFTGAPQPLVEPEPAAPPDAVPPAEATVLAHDVPPAPSVAPHPEAPASYAPPPNPEGPEAFRRIDRLRSAGRLGLSGRRAVRFIAPVVFVVAVVALVAVVLRSGVLGDGNVSPSPSASSTASVSPKPTSGVSGGLYKVKPGDTLSGIAVKFRTSVDKILELNPGLSVNNLTVGERIKLPPH